MNLPNKLTVFRIILSVLMVVVYYLPLEAELLSLPVTYVIITAILIIAAITDKIDGTLARRNNQITNFGKFADPLADKILVISALLLLVEENRIPAWIPIIIILREFAVSGFRLIALTQSGEVIAADIFGKIKTITQMLAVIFSFCTIYGFFEFAYNKAVSGGAYVLNLISSVLLSVSAVLTVLSGFNYLKNGKDILKDR